MKSYPTYLQTFGILLIWLLCGLLSSLLIFPFFSIESALGMLLVYTLSLIMTIAAAMRQRQDFTLKLKKVPPGLIIVVCVSMVGMDIFLDPLLSLIPPSESYQKMLHETVQHPIPFFFMIAVAAPVLEELLFRGVVLNGLLKNYSSPKGLVFSAFFFGLVHGNWAQGISAFIFGLFVGWIYWKTESIIPGIAAHFSTNFVSFIGTTLSKEEDLLKNFSELIGNQLVYWLLVIGAGWVAAAGVWTLHNHYFKKWKSLEVGES